jgi:hypothetical protein
MSFGTLCVPVSGVTQSVTTCVPTQSVGTILRSAYKYALMEGAICEAL